MLLKQQQTCTCQHDILIYVCSYLFLFNWSQLLAGAPEEWHKRLKLMPASHFHYLNTSGCTSVSDIDDADGFDSTCDAMDKANIFDKDQVRAATVILVTVALATFKRVTVT
jgi:Myosin head (motor domain)